MQRTRRHSRAAAVAAMPGELGPRRRLLLLGLATAAAGLLTAWLVTSAAAQTGADQATGNTVVKASTTGLGATLVDARGRTLYLLTADKRAKKGTSVCYAACAKAWPPLLTKAAPKAGPGASAALLGVAKRSDGTRQVTYKGNPLYLFVKDTAARQTKGQKLAGFGGPFCTATLATKPCVWYAVSPTGAAITVSAAKATKLSVAAGSPSEFRFKLSAVTVSTGVVTFVVRNDGQLPHDFQIAGKRTTLIQPGKSQTLKVTFAKAGAYPYLCTVSGHAAAGMKGTLRVN